MEFTLDEAVFLVGLKSLEIERLRRVTEVQAERIRELAAALAERDKMPESERVEATDG